MTQADLEGLVDRPADFLTDADPIVRRLAVSACAPDVSEHFEAIAALTGDADAAVRAEAVEVIAMAGIRALPVLDAVRGDPDERVVEALATAYGEIEDARSVEWLIEAATASGSRQVREAAVAALGAIGDPQALPCLLDLVASGPPQVRRRAVVALTAFDGDEVEAALYAARDDRNPMVREAAEMVVGRTPNPRDP